MEMTMDEAIKKGHELLEQVESGGRSKPLPVNRLVRKLAEKSGVYPLPNLAVEICVASYLEIGQDVVKDPTKNREQRIEAVRLAYCNSLPRLSDADSILDFIACVVHGMAIHVIPPQEGTRLLYGAQVARTALPSPKRRKKGRKSAQITPDEPPVTPDPSATYSENCTKNTPPPPPEADLAPSTT